MKNEAMADAAARAAKGISTNDNLCFDWPSYGCLDSSSVKKETNLNVDVADKVIVRQLLQIIINFFDNKVFDWRNRFLMKF